MSRTCEPDHHLLFPALLSQDSTYSGLLIPNCHSPFSRPGWGARGGGGCAAGVRDVCGPESDMPCPPCFVSQHRERDFRKPTRNHDSHSDLGSAACQPSAEAGAGPVAERARADEFDAVRGGPCGEASELAIAVLHGALKVGLADSPEVDTLDDP